ncbi:MAG: hypothetical protein PHE68_04690 [Candidatus Peribacteraceae bacterium]|nr:hypothetical protein [Candidatus Peribacteraceae bacterium]MDD5075093.1 hypothetical protein [Candidatus Peribacteraceae bacterium]
MDPSNTEGLYGAKVDFGSSPDTEVHEALTGLAELQRAAQTGNVNAAVQCVCAMPPDVLKELDRAFSMDGTITFKDFLHAQNAEKCRDILMQLARAEPDKRTQYLEELIQILAA